MSPPLRNDIWGDGSRVPVIVIGLFAKSHFVDHREHDTLSIRTTIEEVFHVAPLNSLDAHASSLASSLKSGD